MRSRRVLIGSLIFAGGLGAGFWIGRAPPAILAPLGVRGKSDRPPTLEELQAGVEGFRRLFESGDRGGRDRFDGRGPGGPDGDPGHGGGGLFGPRSREESFLALQKALESGDRWEARRALHDLGQGGGGPLRAEQLKELGGLLGSGDRDLIRDLSRALAVAGGQEGLAMVMGFLEDAGQPLDRRRQAIEGLSDLPPEQAAQAVPTLAEFLEKGPPPDLERTAANAIGRLARDKGVETLLGLLGTHPGIRAEAIFDAVGDVGGPGDSKALLALLGGDFSAGAKTGLLRSAARLAARGEDTSALLGLLKEPPAGVSREMVARAIGDASSALGTGVLRDALRATAGDRQAQETIARSLVWRGGKEGLDALLEAAQDPDLKLDQQLLARAFNDYQGGAAVPMMVDLFRSSHDESILEPLARGLARNANKETMESLLGLLEPGGDAWQRRAMARALEDGSSAALDSEKLLTLLHGEKDQEVASSLARALARTAPAAVNERAVELFQGATSPVERIAFAQLLERSSAPETVELLGKGIRLETDSKAQWEMARILGRSGEVGVAQVAGALESDADENHRHSILWGLEASRRPVGPEARSLIVETAGSDASPSIRAQAAEILGRQQDPALIPVLNDILATEQHHDVRARIERAIRELEGRR